MTALDAALWPAARAGEALDALAAASGLATRREGSAPAPLFGLVDDDAVDPAARAMGVEAQSVQSAYAEVERMLRGCGPALLRIPGGGETRLLAVLGCRRRRLRVLDEEGTTRHVALAEVREALCHPLEAPHAVTVDSLLDAAGVAPRARARSRRLLL
ncbi:MAG TPA: hypothetical protein VGX50_21995, partial [Longimicrobium sp.]|nr:hypothetical protein [Longimicrobium sp.]